MNLYSSFSILFKKIKVMSLQLSEDVQNFLKEEYPNVDIDNMSLEELKSFKEEVIQKRQEINLLELTQKRLGNAAYGASASPYFYFFNVDLAADITGECRHLTKTMWDKFEQWFHHDIWERKDLWEKFDFALDPSKKEWFESRNISIYSDTDSTSNSLLISYDTSLKQRVDIMLEDLFNEMLDKGYKLDMTDRNNSEFCRCDKLILNWTRDNELYYAPVKYIMRHKVSKSKFRIKSKLGKEVIVTGDHSCIVFRNGEQLTIKAKDINPKTDKILVVDEFDGSDINISNLNYELTDIEIYEQLEDFNNEYVYDIEVDDDSHTFIANNILVHNSVYVTYGDFFECFTDEYKKKYDTDRKKIEWILKYNQEFQDKQNTAWCEEIYGPRHGKNVHNFELETISRACINLKKKKYLKALSYYKGKFYDDPKIAGTGIEIIKSTTPKLCREILTDLTRSLVFETAEMDKESYIYYFNDKLAKYKKQFYTAPIEDISMSVGIGDYEKYVIDDKEQLVLGKQCPVSVQAIARYNQLAHINGEDNKRQLSGKIKYYNIRLSQNKSASSGYFGFPSGELPDWAPKIALDIQWEKTIVDPINRFLEVMDFPLVNSAGVMQLSLFGYDD